MRSYFWNMPQSTSAVVVVVEAYRGWTRGKQMSDAQNTMTPCRGSVLCVVAVGDGGVAHNDRPIDLPTLRWTDHIAVVMDTATFRRHRAGRQRCSTGAPVAHVAQIGLSPDVRRTYRTAGDIQLRFWFPTLLEAPSFLFGMIVQYTLHVCLCHEAFALLGTMFRTTAWPAYTPPPPSRPESK